MFETLIKFLDADGIKALITRIATMKSVLDDADKSLDSKIDIIKKQVDELSTMLGADSITIEEIDSLFN